MHSRRLLSAALAAAICSPALAPAQGNKPSARFALGPALRPVQDGVEFDEPSESEIEQSSVELVKEEGLSGWNVLGPEGQTLRRFLDTNRDGKPDLWCYFKDGVEVYRDIDADFDNKADQYRWLGTAGTRWGIDPNEDGVIDRWKQISAEEVSAELVRAIAEGDRQRFERLLINDAEIEALGLGETFTAKVREKRDRATQQFSEYASQQSVLEKDARWIHFAAARPGTIPAGTRGTERDITVYENAVTMFESDGQSGQLLIGTLIQSDETWRLIDLPQTTGPELAAGGIFFSGATVARAASGTDASPNDDLQEQFARLEKIDNQLAQATGAAAAKLHDQRATCLETIIAASPADQRDSWVRQLVDTVGAAIQSGSYPGGVARLRKLADGLGAREADLKAYVEYQLISSDYALRVSQIDDPKEFPKVADWWFKSLENFVNEYPDTTEAAQAMLQLGLSKEFEADEEEAIRWYARVAKQFPETDPGRKAAGAVRRLESVGRVISLKGTTLDNKSFDISQLRGKPVVIQYWATWCEPCKQDMKVLRQLTARYARAGLRVVGINVDGSREDALQFAQQNRLPWINLYAPGGLDSSPLANLLGVQTLPTMLLIDQQGKVVEHNITAGQLDAEIDKLVR